LTSAIILFAHGSRDAQWRLPIEAVALQISQRRPALQVRCAYLELCAPSLPAAASELIAIGIRNIRVFPLFLGVGKHAREDMPLLIEEIRAAHPGVEVELLPAAGEYTELVAVLADISLSALA
jgi:sirohydrochlorin cobaltochelatase